jgi:hypothetical protein
MTALLQRTDVNDFLRTLGLETLAREPAAAR